MLLSIREAVQDLPHQFVGLIPFSREIQSVEPIVGIDHIPYGSTSFVEATMALGWKGLSFDVEKFNYKTAADNRNDMLNGEEWILSAKESVDLLRLLDTTEEIFMRPAHDLKHFSGSVFSVFEAEGFLNDAMKCTSSGSYKINEDLLIVMAKPKKILVEWRWFIVGGRVIDGSTYRRNGRLIKIHQDDVSCFEAQKLANKWLPNECCVMDTCLLDGGDMKIVEFNCINGSGFYDHDVKKIMTAWSAYHNTGVLS